MMIEMMVGGVGRLLLVSSYPRTNIADTPHPITACMSLAAS